MAKVHVTTSINGEPMEYLCEPSDTMLDALRGPLGLTGSKEGCASGDCGACSITLDDRLVCSCLMLAVESEGHEVRTIEGMAQGEKLHPLQQKFLESAALQCGICTSGMLVASDVLLRTSFSHPRPTAPAGSTLKGESRQPTSANSGPSRKGRHATETPRSAASASIRIAAG